MDKHREQTKETAQITARGLRSFLRTQRFQRETRGEPQVVEEAVRTALSQVSKPCLTLNT